MLTLVKKDFATAVAPAVAGVSTPAFAPRTKISFAVLDELVEGCIAVVGICCPLTLVDILLSLTPLASLGGGMLSNWGILSSSSNSSSISTPLGISWSTTSLKSLLASGLIADDVCR